MIAVFSRSFLTKTTPLSFRCVKRDVQNGLLYEKERNKHESL